MKITSLGSGSRGNAYLVEHGGEAVLVDCGVCYKRLKDVSFSAILVTHAHADHACGIRTLLKYRDVPVYANALTAEAIAHDFKVAADAFVCFENGQSFCVGPFSILPFSIPHDTSDPVGYLVSAGEREGRITYFHGTDIGTPLDSIGLKLAEADIATLESNHDPVLLSQSGRHPCLIQRIAGPRGHLSNDQACELVRRFASPRLKRLALAHLSRDCNTPHIAEETMRETLRAIGREDICLRVLSQDDVVEL
ncbi:MAG: MBL fold metallo-hydrolase [Kiritimatiellae bacterium]|nr:MBL fold metallo-hydrolase [Kiritimatiellia bacterium]